VWHKVYFDNWFTSPKLIITLWKQGIACLGTVRTNRLQGCQMPSDAEMKRQGRGTTVVQTAVIGGVDLRATKWYDNRGVVKLTSFAAVEPVHDSMMGENRTRTYTSEVPICSDTI